MAYLTAQIPMGRFAEAEEMAAAIGFLSSERRATSPEPCCRLMAESRCRSRFARVARLARSKARRRGRHTRRDRRSLTTDHKAKNYNRSTPTFNALRAGSVNEPAVSTPPGVSIHSWARIRSQCHRCENRQRSSVNRRVQLPAAVLRRLGELHKVRGALTNSATLGVISSTIDRDFNSSKASHPAACDGERKQEEPDS